MYLGDFWVVYMQSKVVREKYGQIFLSRLKKVPVSSHSSNEHVLRGGGGVVCRY